MKYSLVAASALASLLFAGAAHATTTLTAQYFSISEAPGAYGAGGDFGTCCSSPPATLPNIALGSSLVGGMPVSSGGPNPVLDVSASNQILWWTPSVANGVTATGSGTITLPFSSTTYAPNNTGNNDGTDYETAIFSGTINTVWKDVKLTVASDDDALVYLNGKYVGGEPGVHGAGATTLDFGQLNGSNSLEIFYADRAQTGASFSASLAVSAVPEPSTWAMLLIGFAGLGFAGYRRKKSAAMAV